MSTTLHQPPGTPAPPASPRWLPVVALVVTVVVAGVGAMVWPRTDSAAPTPSLAAGRVSVGQAAPDFTAADVTGKQVSLSQFKGKPVWLTFNASWCADCRVEAPDVQTAYEQHRDDGLEVVAVYLSEDSAAVKAFTERLGLTFTHLPDPQSVVSSGYGVPGVPAHFFIDRAGTVRSVQLGVLTPEATQSALAQLIDG